MSDESRVIGRLVYSAAGRDKKRPFIIVGITPDGLALIADGRLHPFSKPKRKKLCHLDIKDVWVKEELGEDSALREFLKEY